MTQGLERLINVTRSLIDQAHKKGLISLGGAQIMLRELTEAAKEIETGARTTAERTVADVRQTAERAVNEAKATVNRAAKNLKSTVEKARKHIEKAAKPTAKGSAKLARVKAVKSPAKAKTAVRAKAKRTR